MGSPYLFLFAGWVAVTACSARQPAGVVPDAGVPGSATEDSGIDAGGNDAGAAADGGGSDDGGVDAGGDGGSLESDAGGDAGNIVDGGAGWSADAGNDAGTPSDAGVDAGLGNDAGGDAGTDGGSDAGTGFDAGADAGVFPARPFPQHTNYAAGTIRPSNFLQSQLDQDVKTFYDHWKGSYLVDAGVTDAGIPLFRVSYGTQDPARTVSEGQGYGMIIVAFMAGYDPNARTIFDGLWRFSRLHPSPIDSRLMDWDVPATASGDDSAFDGDADIAYALLLANAQWGSLGAVNYLQDGKTVITALMESSIGPTSRLPMLGDWVNPDGGTYNQFTPRSSDFMPSHFRAFGQATGNTIWNTVVARGEDVVEHVQTKYSPDAGLLPDFLVSEDGGGLPLKPAPPNFLEGPNDGKFHYNAGRFPFRLALDHLLYDAGAAKSQLQRLNTWIRAKTAESPAGIKAGYSLGGTATGNFFTTFFAAPIGVAAMVDSSNQAWLNGVYASVRTTYEDYFEDSITLLCLIVMSGNYWTP